MWLPAFFKTKIMTIIKYLGKYPVSIILSMVIIYLSLFTPPEIGVTPPNNFDKLVHFAMYAGFCSIIWTEYLKKHRVIHKLKVTVWAVVMPVLFGGGMELAQMFLTHDRSGEWADFLANSLGVLAAAVFFISLTLFRKNKAVI